MKSRESFNTLIAELEGIMKDLDAVSVLNRRAVSRIEKGADDVLDFGALSYTIHNLYSLLEQYFLRISKFFENNLPGESWHKILVERMCLDIPEYRPALIESDELCDHISELLRFRHKFRNMYADELKPDKVLAMQRSADYVLRNFGSVHAEYIEKIQLIRDAV